MSDKMDAAMIERLYRDGMTAVIISPGFGAGWSSWGPDEFSEFMLHDKQLCEAVERKDFDAVRERCDQVMGEGRMYFGGLDKCELEWVVTGKPFYVHEYDGNEWVVTDFRTA